MNTIFIGFAKSRQTLLCDLLYMLFCDVICCTVGGGGGRTAADVEVGVDSRSPEFVTVIRPTSQIKR